jgi:hypothetical protein
MGFQCHFQCRKLKNNIENAFDRKRTPKLLIQNASVIDPKCVKFSPPCLPPGLALCDNASNDVPLLDDVDGEAVQHRPYARLLDQVIGDHLEKVGVQTFAVVERKLDGAAHLRCEALHLDADAFRVVGAALVSVPADRLHPDRGDDASEAAVALAKKDVGAGAARAEGGGQAGGAAANDKDLAAVEYRKLTGRL